MKFKSALRKVTDCDPSSCDEHTILNLAYAILDGKTGRMEYKFRTYDATTNCDLAELIKCLVSVVEKVPRQRSLRWP
jgi:hypothetical protein